MTLLQAAWAWFRAVHTWPPSRRALQRLMDRFDDPGEAQRWVRAHYPRQDQGRTAAGAAPRWFVRMVSGELGSSAGYLQVPGIALTIVQAGAEGWTEDKTRAAIEATPWYNRTTQQQKEWLTLTDAERSQALKRTAVEVLTALQRLYGREYAEARGWSVSDSRIQSIAERVASGQTPFDVYIFTHQTRAERIEGTPAWNAYQEELRQAGAGQVARENLQGELEDAWRTWMGDFIEPTALDQWAERIYQNKASRESFDDFLAQQAQALYPTKPEHIPFSTWIAPARQMLGQFFELGHVNDSEPLLQSYARGEVPSLSALADMARHDPRFTRTDRFRSQSRDVTHSLLQAFGLR